VFLIIIYIKAWFEATSATAAPHNDLVFLKKLYNYQAIDAEISKVAVSKFINHLWYLSPQAMGLAFFDKNINTGIKRKMEELDSNISSNESTKRLKLNNSDMDEFIKNKIDIFVNSGTRDFFKLFNLDESFLENDPSTWDNIHSFKNALNIVTKLRVVNDTSERVIKLMEDYNTLLTNNEEQKQFVLQIVSDYRKKFPDCMKSTLLQLL